MKVENISISGTDKIGMLNNLTTMLSAGIPILEVIESLLEDAKGNQKKFLLTLRADLVQGQRVYVTFSKFPNIFDKVTVNIVKASEEAGTLDVTLRDVQNNIKKDMEFSGRVKSALIYPLFIVGVFVAVMLMILIVVVPKVSGVFSRLTVTLPLPTKILIFMSDGLLKHTIPVVAGFAVLGVGIFFLFKTEKRAIIGLFVQLPLITKLAKEIDMTRFARSLYLLLNAGLPITSSLELAQQVVSNRDVARVVKRARETVSSGKKLSDAFKESKNVIPGIMIKMTEAGERSGTLDKSMLDASEFMDEQVSSTVKTLTTLIEPIMLVVVGIMIGGMMLAIIAPIYGLIGQIQH